MKSLQVNVTVEEYFYRLPAWLLDDILMINSVHAEYQIAMQEMNK